MRLTNSSMPSSGKGCWEDSMGDILIFCDKDSIAYELLTKGRELKSQVGGNLSAAVLGPDAANRAQSYLAYGADQVFVADDANLVTYTTDVYAAALAQIMKDKNQEYLLVGSTKRGKELAGRVAQKIEAGCITDVQALTLEGNALVAARYAYGGSTVSTEMIKTARKVISIMPKTFEASEGGADGETINISLNLPASKLRVIEKKAKTGEAVNLEEAETVLAVGRGFNKKDDLALAQELAAAVKAEIGATKTLVSDYEWYSEERLIGLSGKKCKAKLYIGIGISGQIQHMVGAVGSKVIAAINKDKDALIFKAADYGIIGDIYDVLPKLTAKIKSL